MPVGGDYAYSDHIYPLLELGSPFIKCLALVPNSETGPGNVLVNYWQDLLAFYVGEAQTSMILNHINRLGKVPKSVKKDTQLV